jgi:tetratricopeptide (TPR) repeat protein
VSQLRLVLVFLLFPPVCPAQSNPSEPAPANSYTVSVHELQIPDEARDPFNKGTRLLAEGNWSGSIAQFQKAIEAFPAFYEAYYRQGVAEAKLARVADAESSFRKSIELSSGRYAPPHFGLGLLLAAGEKQFAAGEAMVRAGLALDAADAAGHFALAWILYSAGRLPEAEDAAHQALARQPDLAAAYLLLAQIHLSEGKPGAGADDLDSYFRIAPRGAQNAEAQALRHQAPHSSSNDDVAQAYP